MSATTDHWSGSDDVVRGESSAERQRRRRARLEHLLDLRARLAVTAAEQRSHTLPERWETARLLYGVEETLHNEWPDVYNRRVSAWAEMDDELLHQPPALSPACSICRCIAERAQVNIEPPDAA